MIVTWRIALRMATLVLVAVILQVSFLSYVSVLGAVPDLLPVLIVCFGLLGGAVVGATSGFAAGLLLDALLLQVLGVSSLALLAVGCLSGRYREGFEIGGRMTPALLAGAVTLVGSAGYAVLQATLGSGAEVSWLVVREVVVKALFAFALTPVVLPLVRRVLRPALVDEEPVQRRALLPGRRRRRGAQLARRRLRRAATPGRSV
jgi:rod shape-determining protein MreD